MLGKNSNSTVINEICIDGNVFKNRNLIANKLNEYFVDIGHLLAHEVEESHPISADQTTIGDLDNRPNSIFYLSEISVEQVLIHLKQLEPSKTKISANIFAPSLTAIFNLSDTLECLQ